MYGQKNKILISCSAPISLINFRGKLIEELLKENTVCVFTPEITDNKIRMKLLQMGIEIYENKLKRNTVTILSDIRYIIDLCKVMQAVKPDIFFSYTFKPLIFGSIVASVYKVKTKVAMLTGLGYNFTEDAKFLPKTITQTLLRFSLNFDKSLKIIFHNQDDRQELFDRKIVNQTSKTYVVDGSGVDLSFYRYSQPTVKNIRFLIICRLIVAKGVKEFFEAAKIIHTKYPAVKFVIVGRFDNSQIDSISDELYHEITHSSFVEYTPWTDDVRPFIENASVVVLPSYREGTPRSILEAMAIGRATITTDTPGCRETVNTDSRLKNGFLVPVKNVSGLAESMEAYIQNTNLITQYGLNGRVYAEEKYDVNKINHDMLQILTPATKLRTTEKRISELQ